MVDPANLRSDVEDRGHTTHQDCSKSGKEERKIKKKKIPRIDMVIMASQ